MHEVTTWYLQMSSPGMFKPSKTTDDFAVREVAPPSVTVNKFFWFEIGNKWRWFSRVDWAEDQWQSLVDDPNFQTWVGYANEDPAGYFELQKNGDQVDILFFGLLDDFIGRGYGGQLLSAAIQQAWSMGASRVLVNTCSDDAPHALANYEARGFEQYDVKITSTLA